MSEGPNQLPLAFGGCGREKSDHARRERLAPRQRVVRMVEYAPFPRVSPDPGTRTGFTRDESETGMCLGTDGAERPEELLRIVVRGIDGRPTLDCLGRVVWCRARPDGRYWVGLEVLRESTRRMVPVRRVGGSRRIAVTA